MANVWLGFDLLGVDSWLRLIWGLWVIVVVLVFALSEIRLQMKRGSTSIDEHPKEVCEQDYALSEQAVLVAQLRERVAAQEQEIRELRERRPPEGAP